MLKTGIQKQAVKVGGWRGQRRSECGLWARRRRSLEWPGLAEKGQRVQSVGNNLFIAPQIGSTPPQPKVTAAEQSIVMPQ